MTAIHEGRAGANNPRPYIRETRRVIDISALLRADIPDREHWASVHVAGQRNPAIDLPPRRKWSWSGK